MRSHSIGEDKAIELFDSNWWEQCNHQEIAEFQLFTKELCCPFGVFHEAMEKTLGRPMRTHEFGTNYEGLCAEFLGEREPPTFEEIVGLIPEEKRIIVRLEEKE